MATANQHDDDGDTLADYWRDVKPILQAEGQKRRANNREQSPDRLRDAGIAFETKNMGAHLIVDGPNGKIDFWPGTGLWIDRKVKREKFGVFNLIKHVKGGR